MKMALGSFLTGLDRDLRNGLVTRSKAYREQQMQVQAELLKRNDGQNTELVIRVTAYASCRKPKIPIWKFAPEVVRSIECQQIH